MVWRSFLNRMGEGKSNPGFPVCCDHYFAAFFVRLMRGHRETINRAGEKNCPLKIISQQTIIHPVSNMYLSGI
jgi:hypothetical protein